ncbi:MAG: BLUF domain-containing protein [Spirochaetota bacterium]
MLSYLVYISMRNESCTDEEIKNILASCQKNNSHHDITGVLMYSEKQFVQYLEGKRESILALYDKIKSDTRHSRVIMLVNAVTEERCFPSWQMAAKPVGINEITYKTSIPTADKEEFGKLLSGQKENAAIDTIKKLFK